MPDISKTIADAFLFFLAYNFLRQSRIRSSKISEKHLPVLDELSVGFLAGAFSKLLTTPVANIVTRKQTSSMLSGRSSGKGTDQGSLKSIALQIRTEKGLQGFWSGYSASLVLTLNPSLTFFFFEAFKRTLLPRSQRSNPSAQTTFLLAAISKAMASTITYPFSLAKSRLQVSKTNRKDTESTVRLEKSPIENTVPSNVFSTIFCIAQTEGLSALYEGLGGEVLKGFFSHGITMIVKDAVHKLVIQLYYTILKLLKRYPSPQELARSAREQAGQLAEDVGERTQQLGIIAQSQAGQMAEDLGQRSQQAAVSAKSHAGRMAEYLSEQSQQVAALAKDGTRVAAAKGLSMANDLNDMLKNGEKP